MLVRCAPCGAGSLRELLVVTHCASVDPIGGVVKEKELLCAQQSYWSVNLISGTLPPCDKLCDGMAKDLAESPSAAQGLS
jgi:hypothetical protein